MKQIKRNRFRARRGFSLLEVIVGMVVVGLILVPTTAMMADVLRGQATQRSRAELQPLALGKQNEYAHLTRVSFRDRVVNGSFAAEGYPQLLFQVTCSQATSDGGIVGRLMAIRTQTWFDANGDRVLSGNETSVDLWTSVARATP
jgi:prepilin-type N-terminal cleavage/methylation domain-containing protein